MAFMLDSAEVFLLVLEVAVLVAAVVAIAAALAVLRLIVVSF